MTGDALRVLIVDLNNFARYPTVAVGYLASVLRQAGITVSVFSPLSCGVTGVVREPPVRWWSLIDQRLRYRTAVSRNKCVRWIRGRAARLHAPMLARQSGAVVEQFKRRLDEFERVDAVLVSTYLMYYSLCERMAKVCGDRSIPVIIGGAYFAQREVAREWIQMSGLSALAGGEIEPHLPELVRRAASGERLDFAPGIYVPDQSDFAPAPPLEDLDAIPYPDFSDFPWERYPNRIIPIISGRGCSWGACRFCSDVTSTAGRTFRSRKPERVLDEMARQARQHQTNLFVFTDLKLNSNLGMWSSLIDGINKRVAGARWIGAVHIGARQPNGLSAEELRAARAAGMVRLTTGLESGSQRLLDSMAKGVNLDVTSRCLHDAKAADISVRTTMIVGYPGEETADVEASAKFLEDHRLCIERVSLNRFALMTGTRIHRQMERNPRVAAGLTPLTINHREARIELEHPRNSRACRRAVNRLLEAVHRINRRPLREEVRPFEGVM